MSRLPYIPRLTEQKKIAEAFELFQFRTDRNLDTLTIQPGDPGDDKVLVQIQWAKYPDCQDRYFVKKQADESFYVEKEFCGLSGVGRERVEEISKSDVRWFPLSTLFLPDATQAHQPPPESWQRARAILTQTEAQNDLMMWQLSNPRLDPLRQHWARADEEVDIDRIEGELLGAKPAPKEEREAWKHFVVLLEGIRERLLEGFRGFNFNEEQKKSREIAKGYFGVLLKQREGNYNEDGLNAGLRIAFNGHKNGDGKESVFSRVRSILGSEYPFVSEPYLDEMSGAITAWVMRRFLFVWLSREERRPAELVKEMDPSEQKAFQGRLTDLLLDSKARGEDVEAWRAAYRRRLWALQFQEPSTRLVYPDEVNEFVELADQNFDQQVGFPVLERMTESNLADLRVASRLRQVLSLGGNEPLTVKEVGTKVGTMKRVGTPITWRSFEVPANIFPSDLEETQASQTAFIEVQKNLDRNPTTAARPYRLSLAAAPRVVDLLEELQRKGVPVVGSDDGDQGVERLSKSKAKEVVQSLLNLSDGPGVIEIDPMAEQTLRLALYQWFPGEYTPSEVAFASGSAAVGPVAVSPAEGKPKDPESEKAAAAEKRGSVEGVNWAGLRDQAIHYHEKGNKELALKQFEQAAAAQAGSLEWERGNGWEKSTDWQILDWIARVAGELGQYETAIPAAEKAITVALDDRRRKKTEERLSNKDKDGFRDLVGPVKFIQDENQVRGEEKAGYILLTQEGLIDLKKKKAFEYQAEVLGKEGIQPGIIRYLPYGKHYEANGVAFEVKRGEKMPEVVTFFFDRKPGEGRFNWASYWPTTIIPGEGAGGFFQSEIGTSSTAVADPEPGLPAKKIIEPALRTALKD